LLLRNNAERCAHWRTKPTCISHLELVTARWFAAHFFLHLLIHSWPTSRLTPHHSHLIFNPWPTFTAHPTSLSPPFSLLAYVQGSPHITLTSFSTPGLRSLLTPHHSRLLFHSWPTSTAHPTSLSPPFQPLTYVHCSPHITLTSFFTPGVHPRLTPHHSHLLFHSWPMFTAHPASTPPTGLGQHELERPSGQVPIRQSSMPSTPERSSRYHGGA